MIQRRQILGRVSRGVRLDPQTGQSVQGMKHSGDVVYEVSGDNAISKKTEIITPSRERILNPNVDPNLNEVGQNKNIFKRVQKRKSMNF